VRAVLGLAVLALVLGAGVLAGVALAEATPNDQQYTNTGTTEPTQPPTSTSTSTDTTGPPPTTDTTTTDTATDTVTDTTTADGTSTPEPTSTERTSSPQGQTTTEQVLGETSQAEPPDDGGLPFTGQDLLAFFVVGGALLAGGLVLRRVGRRDSGSHGS
jgi:hypothetical protein